MKTTREDSNHLVLHYSKPRALVMLAVLAGCTLWLAYLILAGIVAGQPVILIAGVVATVAFVPVVIPSLMQNLTALQSSGPVVVIDERGITDNRKEEAFLGWEQIGAIKLGMTQKSHSYLIIDYRSARVAQARQQSKWFFWVRRFATFGDWEVNLRPLRRNDDDVLRRAQRLHQQFIRRQIVQKNGPANQGWSGSL